MLADGQEAAGRLYTVLAYDGTPAEIAAALLQQQSGLDILDDLTSDLKLVESAVLLIAYASDDDPSLGGERLDPNRDLNMAAMRGVAATLRMLAYAVEISPSIEEAAKDFPGYMYGKPGLAVGIAQELVELAAAVQREAATVGPYTGDAA